MEDHEESQDILDSKPTTEELSQIAIGSYWYILGTRLEVDEKLLIGLQRSSDCSDDKAVYMLKLWLHTDPHPTRRRILQELEGMGVERLVLQYKRYLDRLSKFEMCEKGWAGHILINSILMIHCPYSPGKQLFMLRPNIACVILHLHYRSGPNHAEPNRAGPAVQTMLAWFGPAHFSLV